MSVPTELTWDLADPRRPSVDDMGEAALEDDAKFPPVAPTMSTSAMLNQWQMQLAAMGKIVGALAISVRFTGGTPFVYKFTAPTGNLVLGDITVVDDGDGITTLSWPAAKLPTSILEPTVSINGTTAGEATANLASAVSVQVKTKASAAAADLPFTVTIF